MSDSRCNDLNTVVKCKAGDESRCDRDCLEVQGNGLMSLYISSLEEGADSYYEIACEALFTQLTR